VSPSPLLLIVGMHRSGTSLLGSLLPACGIAMPGPLIAGDPHNPEGYFERADVTALQEQLLIDLERWWPSPRGMQPLPEGWLQSRRGQEALQALIALLEPELARQQGPWAIKDPRSSLLLPLWQAACQQLGLPLQLLLAVRDPAEVMVSLVRRDQALTGMDGWRAQRLWWHHNAEVLSHAQHLPLQVISYGHWFEPRAADQQLQQLVPGSSQEQRLQALQAVKPEHRRSRQTHPPGPIHTAVQQLHQRLQDAALQPGSAAALLHWLEQQPAPGPRSGYRQRLLEALGMPANNAMARHPWRYLAEMRVGSDPRTIRQTIQRWQHDGFTEEELRHAAALPATIPQATVHDIKTLNTAEEAVIHSHIIEAGPSGACQLLAMAAKQRVFVRDRQRVGLLRQFGIPAVWLPA
jgi:hypothetical protein